MWPGTEALAHGYHGWEEGESCIADMFVQLTKQLCLYEELQRTAITWKVSKSLLQLTESVGNREILACRRTCFCLIISSGQDNPQQEALASTTKDNRVLCITSQSVCMAVDP